MIYTRQGQLQAAWSIETFDPSGAAAEQGMLGGSRTRHLVRLLARIADIRVVFWRLIESCILVVNGFVRLRCPSVRFMRLCISLLTALAKIQKLQGWTAASNWMEYGSRGTGSTRPLALVSSEDFF